MWTYDDQVNINWPFRAEKEFIDCDTNHDGTLDETEVEVCYGGHCISNCTSSDQPNTNSNWCNCLTHSYTIMFDLFDVDNNSKLEVEEFTSMFVGDTDETQIDW